MESNLPNGNIPVLYVGTVNGVPSTHVTDNIWWAMIAPCLAHFRGLTESKPWKFIYNKKMICVNTLNRYIDIDASVIATQKKNHNDLNNNLLKSIDIHTSHNNVAKLIKMTNPIVYTVKLRTIDTSNIDFDTDLEETAVSRIARVFKCNSNKRFKYNNTIEYKVQLSQQLVDAVQISQYDIDDSIIANENLSLIGITIVNKTLQEITTILTSTFSDYLKYILTGSITLGRIKEYTYDTKDCKQINDHFINICEKLYSNKENIKNIENYIETTKLPKKQVGTLNDLHWLDNQAMSVLLNGIDILYKKLNRVYAKYKNEEISELESFRLQHLYKELYTYIQEIKRIKQLVLKTAVASEMYIDNQYTALGLEFNEQDTSYIPFKILKSIEDIQYGVYSTKYNKPIAYDDPEWYETTKEDTFRILLPNELQKYKVGTCWDQSLYLYKKLTDVGYTCRIVFITTPKLEVTHTAVIYKENDTWNWIENAFCRHRCIHKDIGNFPAAYIGNVFKQEYKYDVLINPNVTAELLLHKSLSPSEFMKICCRTLVRNTQGKESFSRIATLSQKQFNTLLKSNFDLIGQESVDSYIVGFFTKLVNLVFRLFNNFKTTIFNLFKDLKRTELRTFKESNVASMNRILMYDYVTLSELQIPIPKGMCKPYKTTTEKVINSLNTFNMEDRTKTFVAKINDVKQRVMSFQHPDTSGLRDINDEQVLVRLVKDIENCFNKLQQTKTVQFNTVFKDSNCLKDTYDLLLDSEKYEYEVSKVYALLENSTKQMQEILNFIQNGSGAVTKTDLLELSASCTYLANVFDMYGYTVQTLTMLDHNFVETLRVIKSEFGL